MRGNDTSKRPSPSVIVSSSLMIVLLSSVLYHGDHHSDGRLTTLYFTLAPCTGTPAYDTALASTLSVSPPWYLVLMVGNSTLNVGRLYSSTRILTLLLPTEMR